MQIVVDSLLTQYARTGRGKSLVILHGWADSSASFRSLSSVLARTYDVIVLDLPGFGGTAQPKGVWGLNEYVDFIHDFLAKLGVTQVEAFIGHSNGGAIAIRGIADGRLQSKKLILLASAGIRGTNKTRNNVLRIMTKAGKFFSAPLPRAAKVKLRRKLYTAVGSDMLVAESMQETFKRVVGDDVRRDAAKIDLPSLLIYGEADKDTPPWFGRQFHELLSDSSLELLPGAGHFVHLDRPADVEKAIQEFLA